MNIAAKSTKIKPEALAPTKRAAHFHSLSVHLQLHEWKSLNSEVVKPEYWGWKHRTIDMSQWWQINFLQQVTFWTLSDATAKSNLKAHADWTLNVLAMQRDWNVLPLVGTVGEQNALKLAKLCQMMMLDMKNLTVTMKICSNGFLDYDDYPFSKLFNNVMIKWLRFQQLH